MKNQFKGMDGSMKGFRQAHEVWLADHLARRSGDRLRRLEEGYRKAERDFVSRVWWPMFHHFDHLHPEYEFYDFYDGRRYIDFAYVRDGLKLAFEIDGYRAHYSHLSLEAFNQQWVRHMHLLIDGWIVVRIGAADVINRPRRWQQLIQQLLSRYYVEASSAPALESVEEQTLLRFACGLGRPMRLKDAIDLFECNYRTVRKVITRLEDKRLLLPLGKGSKRTHQWQPTLQNDQLALITNLNAR